MMPKYSHIQINFFPVLQNISFLFAVRLFILVVSCKNPNFVFYLYFNFTFPFLFKFLAIHIKPIAFFFYLFLLLFGKFGIKFTTYEIPFDTIQKPSHIQFNFFTILQSIGFLCFLWFFILVVSCNNPNLVFNFNFNSRFPFLFKVFTIFIEPFALVFYLLLLLFGKFGIKFTTNEIPFDTIQKPSHIQFNFFTILQSIGFLFSLWFFILVVSCKNPNLVFHFCINFCFPFLFKFFKVSIYPFAFFFYLFLLLFGKFRTNFVTAKIRFDIPPKTSHIQNNLFSVL